MTNPQDRRPMPNFAPVSGANSTELRLASGYFIVSGVSTFLILCGALVAGMFVEPGLVAAVKEHPVRFLLGLTIQIVAGLGWVWTGILLKRRARLGGILAVLFLLLPLVSAALSVKVSTSTLVLSVIGLLVVASVWNELG